MEKITIKTPSDILPYVGRRARLYWYTCGDLHPRGEGVIEAPGEDSVSVGVVLPTDKAGRVWLDPAGRVWIDPCIAQIELLDACPERVQIRTAADARKWEGRRVELFFEGDSRGSGVLAVQSWGSDGFKLLIDGQCRPGRVGVAIYGSTYDNLTLTPLDTLADRLETARAEVARLEAEIAREATEAAEQKARAEREAEDARYPLPEGWRWERISCLGLCAVGPSPRRDAQMLCVHVFDLGGYAEIVTRGYAGGIDCQWEPPTIDCQWERPPLDVVRVVIARYDAEHGVTDAKPEPYSITVTGWCADIPHTFKSGDVVDLTFASGRVERHTIDVDHDRDILTSILYITDDGGTAFRVGASRGVTKVTLVSRGAQ